MRKSPFSTPRGNGSRGSRSGSAWISPESRNSTGYGERNIAFPVYPTHWSQQSGTDGFIPFNSTSPAFSNRSSTPNGYYDRKTTPPSPYDRNKQRNFYGGRGGRNRSFDGSLGFYSDNRSPRGHSHSFSPFNNRRAPQRGHKSDLATMRTKAISEILDVSSILEDPWKKIMSSMSGSTQHQAKEESNTSINLETMECAEPNSVIEDNQGSFSEKQSQESVG